MVIKDELKLPFWRSPDFLFAVNGCVIIASIIATYFVARKWADPLMVALIVLSVAIFLFVIGFFVLRSFDYLMEANRLKTEFVSIASHQLRTPLSSMKWSLGLLLGNRIGELSVKQKEYLKIIKDNNERMIRLVNDLLNVSRIEQGRMALQPEEFAAKDLAEKIREEFIPIAQASNVDLVLEISDDLPSAYADFQKVRMVLENLVDNAIRYIPGKGRVIVGAEELDGQIRISVNDNGVGIPREDRKRIFTKFFRSENVMKYRTEGTGLGLFIAKAIAENSGGKIGFISKMEGGTIFWFTLPIANKK